MSDAETMTPLTDHQDPNFSDVTTLSSHNDIDWAVTETAVDSNHLVSDLGKLYFRAVVQYGIQVAVVCGGILTNLINILVFWRMGLEESVTITFFFLAISDLLHLATYLIYRLVPMYDFYIGISSGVDTIGFAYPFSLYALYFYDVSMYLTVFAAVQKCCCVTFPLTFKNAFTPRRSYAIITVIAVLTLGIFLPVLTGLPFAVRVNPYTNKSLISVDILPHYRSAEFYWQSVVKVALTPISQLLIIACLVVMGNKLRASADFRNASKVKVNTATPPAAADVTIITTTTDTTDTSKSSCNIGAGTEGNTENVKQHQKTLNAREMRALQSVRFVCLIFVISSLPPTLTYVVQSAYPPLLHGVHLANFKHVLYNSMYFLATINTSVNIVFYLKFNSNYKRVVAKLFRCQGGCNLKQ